MVDGVLRTDNPLRGMPTFANEASRDLEAKASSAGRHVRPECAKPLIGSLDDTFEFFRDFVEHVVRTNLSDALEKSPRGLRPLIREVIRAAVADTDSIEQALGRAVVFADRINREDIVNVIDSPSEPVFKDNEAFFAFSVADALPDFGDQSRYRTRLTKKVTRMLKPRRVLTAVAS